VRRLVAGGFRGKGSKCVVLEVEGDMIVFFAWSI